MSVPEARACTELIAAEDVESLERLEAGTADVDEIAATLVRFCKKYPELFGTVPSTPRK